MGMTNVFNMKNRILILFFVLSFAANAQIYQLKENTTLRKIDLANKNQLSASSITEAYTGAFALATTLSGKVSYDMQIVQKGLLFEKYDEIGEYYILAIIPFTKNPSKNKELYNSKFVKDTTYHPDLFYIITKSQLDKNFVENNSRLGFGTVILPIKVRFGDQRNGEKFYTKFESGINLGVSLTYRLNRKVKEVDTYILTSFSTSQVNLDAENTNNFITSSQSTMALTPSLGFLFQFKNDLQIVLITGIDFLSGESGREWVYRDKPFLGIGLGFNIAALGVKPSN
jgi:hypothetical protein